jgi:hypothetical protein
VNIARPAHVSSDRRKGVDRGAGIRQVDAEFSTQRLAHQLSRVEDLSVRAEHGQGMHVHHRVQHRVHARGNGGRQHCRQAA